MPQVYVNSPFYGQDGTFAADGGALFKSQPSEKTSDNFGRQKVTIHQNVYEADFEYGLQPLRWESLTYTTGSNGTATITQIPSLGGVAMTVGTGSYDLCVRQSRPYHRYQPGKTMYMAANANFGGPVANNYTRVGFFDDSNGAFFEQSFTSSNNPSGMYVCLRSDSATSGSLPITTKVSLDQWNGDINLAKSLNWNNVQMLWIEYAWYGAGTIRFGVTMNSEQYLLHTFNTANIAQGPWSRTGNLPVRYELRNSGSVSAGTTFIHYGVSVLVEGGRDSQRGFTYSYGMNPQSPRRNVPAGSTRFPVLSIQNRPMGTLEYTGSISTATTASITVSGTPWTANQWTGRGVYFFTGSANFSGSGNFGFSTGSVARVVSNTNNTLNIVDVVTGLPPSPAPTAGSNFIIGLINRGQILPQTLVLSSDTLCYVELISSVPLNPVQLTGSNFQALSLLGSNYSFATRDVSATGLTSGSGEVVYAFTSPAGGSGLQTFDLSDFFPLYNSIRGNIPDTLTVAITTGATGSNVGVHIVGQEAMS